MKKNLPFAISLLLMIASYSSLLVIGLEKARLITREDHLVETLAAVFWALAAVVFFILFIRSKSNQRQYFMKLPRNIFYLLLALFCFICMGEEISWGQRIIGMKTPESIMKVNAQEEFNIHNLNRLQTTTDKNTFEKLTTSTRLFFYAWFSYCILIPVVDRFSPRFRDLLNRFAFPVLPLWVGALFILNYVLSKIYVHLGFLAQNEALPVIEIKETLFAVLFFVAGVVFWFIQKNSEASQFQAK